MSHGANLQQPKDKRKTTVHFSLEWYFEMLNLYLVAVSASKTSSLGGSHLTFAVVCGVAAVTVTVNVVRDHSPAFSKKVWM